MLNTYCKLADGNWAIRSGARIEAGTTVPVALRSGATKQVTVGDLVYSTGDNFVHAIAPAARPAAERVGDLAGIFAMFDRAKQHLRYPTIVLGVPESTTVIRISVA